MSRSFKKHPILTDGHSRRTMISKRFANKTVRQNKNKMPSKGNSYKKIYCSYNIHDWISRWDWKEAKKEYENNPWSHWKKRYPTLQDFYNHWAKYYKRK